MMPDSGLPLFERTMRVAHKEAEHDIGNIVKASELVHIAPAGNKNLSLGARKMLNLMLERVAGAAWEDRTFSIAKSELRRGHKTNKHVQSYIDELMHTVLEFDVLSVRNKKALLRIHLLESQLIEEDDKQGLFYFKFTEPVRRMLSTSNTYAILNRKAVTAFESKYSLILYELGCQRVGLEAPYVTLEIDKLRKLFNVPAGSYKDFGVLNVNVIAKAVKEVNALSSFTVMVKKIKTGRSVTSVKFTFYPGSDASETKSTALLNMPRNERRAIVKADKGEGALIDLPAVH